MRKTLITAYILIICILVTSCASVKSNDNIVVERPVTEQEVEMDKELNRKVNVFLSNFAECFIDNFNINEVNEDELISFAVYHNYKNNPNLWQSENNTWTTRIDAKFIEETIKKYFNISDIKHKSVGNEIVYKDGFYSIPLADGEVIPFVQVNKLIQIEDGILVTYGDVYGNGNYLGKDDLYEPLDYWTDEEKIELEIYQKVKAEFKEIEDNGQKRFILMKYSLIQ